MATKKKKKAKSTEELQKEVHGNLYGVVYTLLEASKQACRAMGGVDHITGKGPQAGENDIRRALENVRDAELYLQRALKDWQTIRARPQDEGDVIQVQRAHPRPH